MFTHSAKDKNIILDYWLDLLLLVIPSAKELQEKYVDISAIQLWQLLTRT